jgi:hypothetical protein
MLPGPSRPPGWWGHARVVAEDGHSRVGVFFRPIAQCLIVGGSSVCECATRRLAVVEEPVFCWGKRREDWATTKQPQV